MRSREAVLAQAALEFAQPASQCQRALDRHSVLQIPIEEVFEAIDARRAGDLDVDAFLNQRMLQPMPDIGSIPDALSAPDIFYPFETLS